MVNIFIIHGAYGYPEENWFPWLKEKLENLGHKVFVPQFPTPKNQDLNSWKGVFKEYISNLNNSTIVIGHSTGVAFLLSIMEELDFQIDSAFLVAGFVELLGNDFDPLIRTFVERRFDWDKIRRNCNSFFIYNSKNDPYVTFEIGKNVANKIGVNYKCIKDAGHFNEKTGYLKFEVLLNDVLKRL